MPTADATKTPINRLYRNFTWYVTSRLSVEPAGGASASRS